MLLFFIIVTKIHSFFSQLILPFFCMAAIAPGYILITCHIHLATVLMKPLRLFIVIIFTTYWSFIVTFCSSGKYYWSWVGKVIVHCTMYTVQCTLPRTKSFRSVVHAVQYKFPFVIILFPCVSCSDYPLRMRCCHVFTKFPAHALVPHIGFSAHALLPAVRPTAWVWCPCCSGSPRWTSSGCWRRGRRRGTQQYWWRPGYAGAPVSTPTEPKQMNLFNLFIKLNIYSEIYVNIKINNYFFSGTTVFLKTIYKFL